METYVPTYLPVRYDAQRHRQCSNHAFWSHKMQWWLECFIIVSECRYTRLQGSNLFFICCMVLVSIRKHRYSISIQHSAFKFFHLLSKLSHILFISSNYISTVSFANIKTHSLLTYTHPSFSLSLSPRDLLIGTHSHSTLKASRT